MYIGVQQNSLYLFTKMKNANIDFKKLFITQKYKQINCWKTLVIYKHSLFYCISNISFTFSEKFKFKCNSKAKGPTF